MKVKEVGAEVEDVGGPKLEERKESGRQGRGGRQEELAEKGHQA